MGSIFVFSVVAYFFSEPLLDFLIRPLKGIRSPLLYFQAPHEAFLVRLKVSLLAGLLAGSPVFLSQLWLFIVPGLHRRERRILLPLILISAFLFLLGSAFAFGVLIPVGLQFLLSFQTTQLRPLLAIGPYFSFLMTLVLCSGVLFVLPVIILGLVAMRLLNVRTLERSRKEAIVLVLLLAAILTPSSDPMGQILLSLPLFLLYEGCIWVGKGIEKKRGI